MLTKTNNGVVRAEYDAIESVHIRENNSARQQLGDYAERPARYMVKFYGETRLRRVYATPLGNVAAFYVYSKGERIHVDMAMDAAMHRKEEP